MDELHELPDGWLWAKISEISEVNPKKLPKGFVPDDFTVSFIPMDAVDAHTGSIIKWETRNFAAVRDGYTGFIENDVIFAKITPCMENGKSAVARNLTNGIAFGSTEFHVIRAEDGISADYIHQFVRQEKFRNEAEAVMTGTAGQERVPKDFLACADIPVAPTGEQKRLIERVDELFSKIQHGQAALSKLPTLLKHFRQSLLAAACSGRIVPQDPSDEPASILLEHFKTERRKKWELEIKSKGKNPEKVKYPYDYPQLDTSELPELPIGWIWTRLGDIVSYAQNGLSKRNGSVGQSYPVLRLADLKSTFIDLSNIRNITLTKAEIDKYSLQDNDILVVRVNGSIDIVGKFLVFSAMEGIAFCDHLIRIKIIETLANPNYIRLASQLKYSREFINQNMVTTAGQNTISQETLFLTPIPLPPLSEQEKIINVVNGILINTEAVIEQHNKKFKIMISQLKQGILNKAFRGELVEQDPNDESASVLLERILEQREAQQASKPKKSSTRKKKELQSV